MRVRFAGDTDTGRKRSHNEDYLYLPDEERLVMVADGMGGHACGDIASKMAVDTVVEFFKATMAEERVAWPFMVDSVDRRLEYRLVAGVKLANLRIFEASQRDEKFRGMGTTIVTGLLSEEGHMVLAHVGDSRIYRFRKDELKQLTEDHSLLNDYIKMKRITEDEIANFPHKNVIVRALGMKDTVAVDVLREEVEMGDVYVFCTDGLSGMIDDPTIAEALRSESDLDRCCERLISLANENGGQDNITVALARLEQM
ncbi:MAG: Stp1/IreP family PP2C-type Ser/Thr phosphatase [Deltaproteobacteria bacterium]|nr:Stp1/IreP family PP2C-type Ser/Thr phosphatase [Deltaproteobacteria bacterium]